MSVSSTTTFTIMTSFTTITLSYYSVYDYYKHYSDYYEHFSDYYEYHCSNCFHYCDLSYEKIISLRENREVAITNLRKQVHDLATSLTETVVDHLPSPVLHMTNKVVKAIDPVLGEGLEKGKSEEAKKMISI